MAGAVKEKGRERKGKRKASKGNFKSCIGVGSFSDKKAEIGYANIGYVGFGQSAGFAHVNFDFTTHYALLQNSLGGVSINAPTGQSINFYNANSTHICKMNASGIYIPTGSNIHFEGTGSNAYETFIDVVNPTTDRTFTLPNATGTALISDGNIFSTSNNITIDAQGSDTDIIFKGTDGSTDITFLTLDGSDRGVLIPGSGSETSHRLQVGSKIAMFDDGNAHLHSLGGTFWINANQAASVRINNQQNGDVILTNGTGKVGIGTDAPNSPLHVVGNVEVQGHVLPTADDTYDLGSSSKQWRDIYTGDINLNNTKTRDNEVDGTRGSWTIQEGADDLFLINRVSGKKYKFKLEEIK